MKTFTIRKGLDLNLQGEAKLVLDKCPLSASYALKPSDFTGIVPRPVVKEGDRVKAGDALFVDKATEKIKFVSPVSGTVAGIDRGERRKILRFRVEADEVQESKTFDVKGWESFDAASAVKLLLESGLFAFFRQRPYDVIASADDTPRDIFVSTFSKMPLAADVAFVLNDREKDFCLGVDFLTHIAPVHVGAAAEQEGAAFLAVEKADVNLFKGPNPAGNVGVQINHVNPVNKGEVVWTMAAENVAAIGAFLRTGHTCLTRRIAVAGSQVKDAHYVETLLGAPLSDLLKDNLNGNPLVGTKSSIEESLPAFAHEGHVRIINGNPLVGTKSSTDDYLSAFVGEVTAIPEGDNVDEAFGWIAPRFNDYSTSHSYFSWLFGKKKKYNLDCRIKGGERHMIMSAEYERVFPMDIYPSYLIKALLTGDIDRQEALGIYEVAPEDFAVAEFVDSSKLELQRIVREGLDLLRKENA